MAAYLDTAGFRLRSRVAANVVDSVEAAQPGFTAQALDTRSGYIDGRLRKRYPNRPRPIFTTPVPECVLRWLVDLVSYDVMVRDGFRSTDEQGQLYVDDKKLADAELKEAADSKDGLFDLPIADNLGDSAIAAPEVLGYSEASPYVAFDRQAAAAHVEDSSGVGTGD